MDNTSNTHTTTKVGRVPPDIVDILHQDRNEGRYSITVNECGINYLLHQDGHQLSVWRHQEHNITPMHHIDTHTQTFTLPTTITPQCTALVYRKRASIMTVTADGRFMYWDRIGRGAEEEEADASATLVDLQSDERVTCLTEAEPVGFVVGTSHNRLFVVKCSMNPVEISIRELVCLDDEEGRGGGVMRRISSAFFLTPSKKKIIKQDESIKYLLALPNHRPTTVSSTDLSTAAVDPGNDELSSPRKIRLKGTQNIRKVLSITDQFSVSHWTLLGSSEVDERLDGTVNIRSKLMEHLQDGQSDLSLLYAAVTLRSQMSDIVDFVILFTCISSDLLVYEAGFSCKIDKNIDEETDFTCELSYLRQLDGIKSSNISRFNGMTVTYDERNMISNSIWGGQICSVVVPHLVNEGKAGLKVTDNHYYSLDENLVGCGITYLSNSFRVIGISGDVYSVRTAACARQHGIRPTMVDVVDEARVQKLRKFILDNYEKTKYICWVEEFFQAFDEIVLDKAVSGILTSFLDEEGIILEKKIERSELLFQYAVNCGLYRKLKASRRHWSDSHEKMNAAIALRLFCDERSFQEVVRYFQTHLSELNSKPSNLITRFRSFQKDILGKLERQDLNCVVEELSNAMSVAFNCALTYRSEIGNTVFEGLEMNTQYYKPSWLASYDVRELLIDQLKLIYDLDDELDIDTKVIEIIGESLLRGYLEECDIGRDDARFKPSFNEARSITTVLFRKHRGDEFALDRCIYYKHFDGILQICDDDKADGHQMLLDLMNGKLKNAEVDGVSFNLFALSWYARSGLYSQAFKLGKVCPKELQTCILLHEPMKKYQWIHDIRQKNMVAACKGLTVASDNSNKVLDKKTLLCLNKLTSKLAKGNATKDVDDKLSLVQAQTLLESKGGKNVLSKSEMIRIVEETMMNEEKEDCAKVKAGVAGLKVAQLMEDSDSTAAAVLYYCIRCQFELWKQIVIDMKMLAESDAQEKIEKSVYFSVACSNVKAFKAGKAKDFDYLSNQNVQNALQQQLDHTFPEVLSYTSQMIQ